MRIRHVELTINVDCWYLCNIYMSLFQLEKGDYDLYHAARCSQLRLFQEHRP